MYKTHHIGNQHGGTTLAMTVILLFVMTLVTLYAAKTSIKEQQISANQYRAEQSLSTANGALDWGVAYYSAARGGYCIKGDMDRAGEVKACLEKNGVCILDKTLTPMECEFIYTKSNPLVIDPDLDDDILGSDDALSLGKSDMYYAFVDEDGDFGDAGVEYPHIKVKGGMDPDIYKTQIKIYGVGHSDDFTGKRIVSQDVDTFNIFGDDGPGGIRFPLISKELISDNTGGLTVINRYENRTIWSGDGQTLSGNTHTYIAKPSLHCHEPENRPACINMEPDLATDMEASEGEDKINSDIMDGDANLSNLDKDLSAEHYDNEFFLNFFGFDKAAMKSIITATDGQFANTKSWADLIYDDITLLDDPLNALIWIEGDYSPSGTNDAALGTDKNPVILIINGDLKGGGNTNIIGILYVIGAWSPGSNNTIRGLVIVEGGLSGTGAGGATIVYDNDLLYGEDGAPDPGTVASTVLGTWADWGNAE